MDGYHELLSDMYEPCDGQRMETTTPISAGAVHAILEHSETVRRTRKPLTIQPKKNRILTGDEPVRTWEQITALYDIRDPVLYTSGTADALSYEIRADHYTNNLYNGQWMFHDLDEAAVWTGLNDV